MILMRGLAGLALLLVSCSSTVAQSESETPADQPATVQLGQPFELAVGGAAVIAETGLQVTLRAVPEDSRCPPDVNCIWAGRVSIELEAQAPGEAAETFTLSTCCGVDASQRSYAGQTTQLADVAPGPARAGQSTSEQDYRVQLVVST